MKSEVDDSEHVAGPFESGSHTFRAVGEYELAITRRLPLHDGPCFLRVFEATLIPLFLGWMLCIPDKTGAEFIIVVCFSQTADFCLALCRVDRELQDVVHRNHCSLVSTYKKLAKSYELIGRRPPVSFS